MKTSPLYFVRTIFAVELNKRQGRLTKKASSLLVGNSLVAKSEKSLIFGVGCTPGWQAVLGIILKLREY